MLIPPRIVFQIDIVFSANWHAAIDSIVKYLTLVSNILYMYIFLQTICKYSCNSVLIQKFQYRHDFNGDANSVPDADSVQIVGTRTGSFSL